MRKKLFSVLSIIVIVSFVLTACGKATTTPTVVVTATEVGFADQPFAENLPTAPTINTPLVVAYDQFSQKFSSFFGDSGYDMDVVAMTQIQLITTDRTGGIIYNAIEGETVAYNGTDYLYKGAADNKVEYDKATDTTTYTTKLRVGMKFSDGEPVTADDIIFTYYTFLDPTYVGSTTLSSYDIVGLKDYQTQTTSDVYDKYATMADAIVAAGPDHTWASTDSWTEEQQTYFWTKFKETWLADLQSIVDYCMASYIDNAKEYTGMDSEAIKADETLQVPFTMALWGYGTVENNVLTAPSGATFDLATTKPTIEDFYNEAYAAYEGDINAYGEIEPVESPLDLLSTIRSDFVGYWGPKDEAMGGKGVPNISGIKKVDDYTVTITTKGYSAPAVYQILGIDVTPMHYYGDVSKYDYENNKFGFDFGDLSKQQSLTATPMGAGPYKFVKYENRVVYFEANPYFYRGCPKIAEIQFKETASSEVASAVQTGTVDAGELTGSRSRFEEVASYNSNGEITGDVITTNKVDNLGYGYIGINADTVNVGGVPDSDASKNLRKAFATVYAVYRDVAIDSYYGEAASVINYPISNTSWAAPQPTDEDYKIAFSTDVKGEPIYTPDMTQDQKYVAAEEAALGFLEAAGFTVADGKVTAAPEGAKLSYEVIVPGDGTGDHPAFAILTGAQTAMANIGMELKINDPADANVLWDSLDAGTQEMWTAAWGATIDPDMYQIYHSSGVVGAGGSDSNHYHIRDAQLDEAIVAARQSDDQSFRKQTYKQALDIIIDWAVEIPTYQRQNCVVFSTKRINIATITPDITTYWGWLKDVELLEMN